MTTYLGLDLGTASLGWAFIDIKSSNEGIIYKTGSRIFPESLDDKGKTKNTTKRNYRLQRRQTKTKRNRKQSIREILHGAGMLLGSEPNILEKSAKRKVRHLLLMN